MENFFAFATETDITSYLDDEETVILKPEAPVDILHEEEVNENDRSNWADVVHNLIFRK